MPTPADAPARGLNLLAVRSRWLSWWAIGLHLALAAWVAGCAVATWWQVGRAASGNDLSYTYAFEWPLFAIAGVYCWWSLLHTSPEAAEERAARRAEDERAKQALYAARRDRAEEGAELAAYNDHLAALAASGRRKGWRH